MKDYHIYVFTQDGCPPCDVVKTHVSTLTPEEQAELILFHTGLTVSVPTR